MNKLIWNEHEPSTFGKLESSHSSNIKWEIDLNIDRYKIVKTDGWGFSKVLIGLSFYISPLIGERKNNEKFQLSVHSIGGGNSWKIYIKTVEEGKKMAEVILKDIINLIKN